MFPTLDSSTVLPTDASTATLIARAWTPAGPSVVLVCGQNVVDITHKVPTDLLTKAISRNYQYPDGLAPSTGTMFAPTYERDTPGMDSTHKKGDIATISTPRPGVLINRVNITTEAEPCTFGTGP